MGFKSDKNDGANHVRRTVSYGGDFEGRFLPSRFVGPCGAAATTDAAALPAGAVGPPRTGEPADEGGGPPLGGGGNIDRL